MLQISARNEEPVKYGKKMVLHVRTEEGGTNNESLICLINMLHIFEIMHGILLVLVIIILPYSLLFSGMVIQEYEIN